MENLTCMEYPKDDNNFEDTEVTAVAKEEGGWQITKGDGCCFFVPADHGIEPVVGMKARFYLRGVGGAVRGLFLDGQKVFYRTEAEQKEKTDIDLYGRDAEDLLARWDAGRSVFSISMGGLGPGYEQCIQITAFEILRHLLATKPDHTLWEDPEFWKPIRDKISDAVQPKIEHLGLSGAQWGVAVGLGAALYMRGPRQCFSEVPDRLIQVERELPQCREAS